MTKKKLPPAAERKTPERATLIERIFNGSPHGIMVFGSDGRTILANTTVARLTGYSEKELTSVEETLRLLVGDSTEGKKIGKLWGQNPPTQKAPYSVIWVTTRQGLRVCLRCMVTPLPPDNVMISLSAVSDQMMMEEQYHALFEQEPDAVLLFEADTRKIVQFNTRSYENLGYTREEFKLMRLDDFVVTDNVESIVARINGVLSGKVDAFERCYRKKNGEIINVKIHARPILIGDRRYIQAIVRDVTEEKHAEKAIRESEEKFRNLAEQSPNMIFINQRGCVVYANVRCEEIMGYSRNELCDPSFNFMTLVAPECRPATIEHFSRHKKGQEVPPYEYVILTKPGKRIPAVISTKLMSYDGAPAILGIVTDISELKQAEEGLRESASKLRKQTKELEAKNAALKEVLTQIESEKLEIRKHVTANAEKLLLPVIKKMKARSQDNKLIDILESNLNDLTSRFGATISAGSDALSARETEISNMIRGGLSSKEIAEQLGIALRTIDTYRNRIRKKLGISGRQVNLFTHLQSIR